MGATLAGAGSAFTGFGGSGGASSAVGAESTSEGSEPTSVEPDPTPVESGSTSVSVESVPVVGEPEVVPGSAPVDAPSVAGPESSAMPEPLLVPEVKVVLESDPTKARNAARAAGATNIALENYRKTWRRFGLDASVLGLFRKGPEDVEPQSDALIQSGAWMSRPAWLYLVLIALALIGAEWFFYQRRWIS